MEQNWTQKKVDQLLVWLQGKKGVLASLLMLTNGYLLNKNIYSEIDYLFIGSALIILFGIASYQTGKMYAGK